MRVTLLGCGGSSGVPLASGDWGICDPRDPRNRRRRPSILIEVGGRRIVVDTGPDFRDQWLGAGGGRLDAVIYTHAHADHTHGIDDLKSICTAVGGPVAAYGAPETLARLEARFPYAFDRAVDGPPYFRPRLEPRHFDGRVAGVPVRTVVQKHGRGRSTGLRIGAFGYSTDVSDLDEEAFAALEGLDVWIVGAGAPGWPVPNHAPLARVLEWIERLDPKETILTHLGHHMDYRTISRGLPARVRLGVDNMVVDLGSGPPFISHNIHYDIQGPDPILGLRQVMARLRAPVAGCPWDIEQTFETIAPYTVEEAYEVDDAIRSGDLDAIREELGDLLFQVVFHARMAEELGAFDLDDVARTITAKMLARHPHVFGDANGRIGDPVPGDWETRKEIERRRKAAARGRPDPGALDGVPTALPALSRAEKLQKRAARSGFDWPDAEPVFDKLREELRELAEPDADRAWEIGDVLFSAVNLARKLSIPPETALRDANSRFERRFRRVEALARRNGIDMAGASPAHLDDLWERAKSEEVGRKG